MTSTWMRVDLGRSIRTPSAVSTLTWVEEYHAPTPPPPPPPLTLTWKQRIKHFTWSFYGLSMATGGIGSAVYSCPLPLPGFYIVGLTYMFITLVLFILTTIAISLRFYFWPKTFKASLLHPTESLFVPAPVISLGIILLNVIQYSTHVGAGEEWIVMAMTICYWLYLAVAIITSVGVYTVLWSTQTYTIAKMTPIWIFPAYPLLLAGPLSGCLSGAQSGNHVIVTILGGVIVQGIAFMVSMMIYSAYFYRLMTQKLPSPSNRPAMFISVGPSAFTITGLITMGQHIQKAVSSNFMGNGQLAGQMTGILADWVGVWLWGLAVWFFLISCAAHVPCFSFSHRGRVRFGMAWCSYLFPNTALASATFTVAETLHVYPLELIGTVLLCVVNIAWVVVVVLIVRAIIRKRLLWPGKQEDRDEGGWTEGGKDAENVGQAPKVIDFQPRLSDVTKE